ncbi:MAG: hydantoinase B/oxoprolinase family protein [Hyphomicrobiales bacterium]|nr:hydantoinase B/oxoprolinase family protein [Hyphomicrobiales bacterium]
MTEPADTAIDPILFEVIRNRLVAITEEMRIALQSVSGSPTVTEASDFFNGLFLPDGSVISMGFQVAYHAPVCSQFVRHITNVSKLLVRDGDMFIGNDPYIAALHQNDVQMVGPIFVGDEIIAWAGVEAHETDVGGMDFASWSPRAREVFQEGVRIPCVKLVDRGELRDDVLEMILAASRLPGPLGLDIRAFMATLTVARARVADLAHRYGVAAIKTASRRMIASSEQRMRARLAELPDGEYRGIDFLEHDGHANVLYKLDCRATKRGEKLTLDYSGCSKQAPGFINCTRSGLTGAVCGSILPTLAWDMQWNEGALAPIEIVAPDGLVCTAKHPAPVGSATVETIWVTANATMLALNKMLMCSEKHRGRAQGLSAGVMATFNLGGVNQFGERFGLHLMDPLAAGSAAWPSKDGVNAGGPITSPFSGIADVERNEQVSPLFYLHRRLARDTGGAGRRRGGVGAEIALTLGGIEEAEALVMTHGVEVPNGHGLAGGWPGSTVRQTWGRGAVEHGRGRPAKYEVFGPKPGLMRMTNRDVFAVSWQGGGGLGDPLARDVAAVADDVARGLVSPEAAQNVYGVVIIDGVADAVQSTRLRERMRKKRLSASTTGVVHAAADSETDGEVIARLGDDLRVVRRRSGTVSVVTAAGAVLSSGHTRWRAGARKLTREQAPAELGIRLHAELAVTTYYCPISGAQIAVDIHRKDESPGDDVVLDLERTC